MNEAEAIVIITGILATAGTVSVIAYSITRLVTSKRRQSVSEDEQAQIDARLTRIENAIDAVATEVERVAADQRYGRLASRPDERR
jgi:cell division protein FtsL